MPNYTLTYSEKVQGWPSFYSYVPEYMIGMNQYFYTFKGGNLWRHNTNSTRNNFYGVQYTTRVNSVFNDLPLENKVYKTISLESTSAWDTTVNTDIQSSGFINKDWMTKKEGAWFGFIRNNADTGASTTEAQWELRSLNGLGKTSSVGGTASAPQLNFAVAVDIGSKIGTGDNVYYAVAPSYSTPVFAGVVDTITVDKRAGTNRITLDATVSGTNPIPGQNDYFLFIQNPNAESYGFLGHYLEFQIENDDTTATEIIAVKSDVMKSYP